MSADVVALPTAAPRKVRQHWNKRTREERALLPQFPRSHALAPFERKAVEQAKAIRDMERTPALLIATAIFQAMDKRQKLLVQAFLAMAAVRDGPEASASAKWVSLLDDDRGERATILRALERLDSGEWA